MREVYRSRNYQAGDTVRRYASYHHWTGMVRTYEVNASSRTIREYDTDGTEYPTSFVSALIDRDGGQIEWK